MEESSRRDLSRMGCDLSALSATTRREAVGMRTIFGVFLIVHGLIHVMWFIPEPDNPGGPPWPFSLEDSWLLNAANAPESLVRGLAVTLAVLSIVGFVGAGLGVLGVPGVAGVWSVLTIASAVVSLLLVALFWHLYFIVGLALDVGLLVAMIGGRWPSTLVQ